MSLPIPFRVASRTDIEYVSGSAVTTRINLTLATGDIPTDGVPFAHGVSLFDLTSDQVSSVTHDLVDVYVVPRGTVATFTTGSI